MSDACGFKELPLHTETTNMFLPEINLATYDSGKHTFLAATSILVTATWVSWIFFEYPVNLHSSHLFSKVPKQDKFSLSLLI